MKYLKYFFLFLLAVFLIVLAYFILNFQVLTSIFKTSLNVKERVEMLSYTLDNRNFSELKKQAQFLDLELSDLLNTLSAKKILFFASEQRELKFTVETAILFNNSLITLSDLALNLDKLAQLSEQNILDNSKKEEALIYLSQFEPELNGLQANLKLLEHNLSLMSDFKTLSIFSQALNELSLNLKEINEASLQVSPILSLLPSLIGFPEESRFLILFQNNDELRPTGGFIGSYATLKVADFAENIEMSTGDIYHLDMPSIDHLETIPPEPIAKYMKVKKWYLRDSNWSPDWPTSAAFIENLFYQEAQYANLDFKDLTAILAITPDLVSDLISLVGDIEFEGEVYTPDNIQKLLQYQVEVGYIDQDISSWDRKNIMNDLAHILKERLKSLSLSQLPELLKIINQAIVRKDLLIYYTNPSLQTIVSNMKADGSVVKSDKDYLMVVDANLAAFKTDAVMQKDWYYNLSNTEEGLRVDLTLKYSHQGDFDWRTTRYRSYTRVLTPSNSEFIGLLGNYQDFKQELKYNKKIYGFFISIEPGTSQEYTLSYLLPNSFVDDYELYLQRQPGSRINSFTINFPFYDYYLKTDLQRDKIINIYENSTGQ
jgi:hypothetical protein